jgi:hypothetical protein
MHTLITHILYHVLPPSKEYRQIVPICSNLKLIAQGKYFLGYDGSFTLYERSLEDSESGKIYKLEVPIDIVEENQVWMNSMGEIFYGPQNIATQNWHKIGALP